MSEPILLSLKSKLDSLSTYGQIDATAQRNALKEELQMYVLNFIYHHPVYSNWIMYGGSALRIIHGLDRMSVDLDFEVDHEITEMFLEKLQKELTAFFFGTYAATPDFLFIKTHNRGLLLKFNVGKTLSMGHPSKQVHIKIDFNHFAAAKTVTERRPVIHDQFSFVITTYNMSALMASKIAAIFLREQRGIDETMYDYKGRDIYDLLWYMDKKAIPDFDYLTAKKINLRNPKALFDKLTIDILNYEKMDELLRKDIAPLFLDQTKFEFWLKNWRNEYLRLLGEYKINVVKALENIRVHQDLHSDNFSFVYRYRTEEGQLVRITYTISDYWLEFREGELTFEIDEHVSNTIEFTSNGVSSRPASKDKLKQYATLFYLKTEGYLKKANRVMLGGTIATKVIRMTADNLNPKEQIVLTKSALLSCELDDLLK